MGREGATRIGSPTTIRIGLPAFSAALVWRSGTGICVYSAGTVQRSVGALAGAAVCAACGGMLRPDVVMFEELLREAAAVLEVSPARLELARTLAAMGQAHRFLQRAFERLPPGVTPQLLRRQALQSQLVPFEQPDYRQLLPLIERWRAQRLRIAIFGTGAHTDHLFAVVPELNTLQVLAFLDSDPEKRDSLFRTRPVQPPSWAEGNCDIVLCSSFAHEMAQMAALDGYAVKVVPSHIGSTGTGRGA